MKKAIQRIARIFEVSYQTAKTRTQKAIKEGLVASIAVVRAEIDTETWHKMGFKSVWRTSSRASRAGVGGVEVAATPERHPVRDSGNREGPALSFSQEDWTEFLASVKRPREHPSSDDSSAD
jgi:hypothetical protein